MGWVGVDLDGTLAHYDPDTPYDHTSIGMPLAPMIERVRNMLSNGIEVRIFTARAHWGSEENWEGLGGRAAYERGLQEIRIWCKQHLGRELPITCEKDSDLLAFYDDRAIQVVPNVGDVVEPCACG